MANKRRILLGATGVAAVAAGFGIYRKNTFHQPRLSISNGSGKPLNVLLIVSDQERSWAQLPAGFIEKHCPNRAWLLNHGTSITRANTTSQMCSMARGTIYTGMHSPNNGLWDNTPLPYAENLKRTIPTVGTVFQDAGYTTGYTGKWHLTHFLNEGEADAEKVKKTVQGFGFDYAGIGGETDGALVGTERDGTTAQRSVEFINRNKGAVKPWMLAVNLLNPHDIMYYTSGDKMTASRVSQFPDKSARPPTTGPYAQDLGYDVFGTWGPKTQAGKPKAVLEFNKTMDEGLGHMEYGDVKIAREFQNYYYNCLRDCDQHLGTVLQGLRDSGQLERTVILFTSDHGEFLGAHGMRGKGSSIYREASEVPFVVVHPEGKKATQNNSLISHADILPTLLGLVGIDSNKAKEAWPGFAGHDMSALISDPTKLGVRNKSGLLAYWTGLTFLNHTGVRRFDEIRRRPLPTRIPGLTSLLRESATNNRGAMRGLITEQYKFARYFKPVEHQMPLSWDELAAKNDIEMYDIGADPMETKNLAYLPQHQAQVIALNAQLNALIKAEIGKDDGHFLPLLVKV
jgi:arylsulfatase A-like enzyme